MGKANRVHTPAFKAQVALAAIKGDRTISQVAAHYEIHVNLVAHWKKQLLEGAAAVFDPTGKSTPPPDDPKSAELYETMVLKRGWSAERFGRLIARTLAANLLPEG